MLSLNSRLETWGGSCSPFMQIYLTWGSSTWDLALGCSTLLRVRLLHSISLEIQPLDAASKQINEVRYGVYSTYRKIDEFWLIKRKKISHKELKKKLRQTSLDKRKGAGLRLEIYGGILTNYLSSPPQLNLPPPSHCASKGGHANLFR